MASPHTQLRSASPRSLHLVANARETTRAGNSPLSLWHLLSLDAPTVAATWTVFLAWCAGVPLPLTDPLAMFLAVWMLYATDRLLDARPLSTSIQSTYPELEERHRFHHRHRTAFLRCLVTATIPLAYLLHRLNPAVLERYALLATLLAGWLLLVHAQPAPSCRTRRLPKELAVGIFFPAAVFIPTIARAPALRPALLPSAILFASVCSLNCLFLYAWEHPYDHSRAHATTRWALDRLTLLSLLVILACAALALFIFFSRNALWTHWLEIPRPTAAPIACAFSAAALLVLHRFRHNIAPILLRAFADLVLLTPVIIVLLDKGLLH